MDTQVQPSFIPKKPLVHIGTHPSGATMGLLFLLVATLVFVAALVAGGGVFLLQKYLQQSIVDKSAMLKANENAFELATIKELAHLDNRIKTAGQLIQKHTTAIPVFYLIGQQTLKSVQFTGFSYEVQEGGAARVSLIGTADSFATVALQSDQLSATPALREIVFSSVVVNALGRVGFSVQADVDVALTNYAKNLGVQRSIPDTLPPQIGTSTTATTTPL